MHELRPSSEDEMILAFIQAEWNSPRFGPLLRQCLREDAALVEAADLNDPLQNELRKNALVATRGYRANIYLFPGFPLEVEWVRLACTRADIAKMKYAKYETWTTLTRGTRLVRDGAANVDTVPTKENVDVSIRAVARAVDAGRRFPALIVAADARDAVHILVEGHTRATAYALALPVDEEVEVIAAYTPTLSEWGFY